MRPSIEVGAQHQPYGQQKTSPPKTFRAISRTELSAMAVRMTTLVMMMKLMVRSSLTNLKCMPMMGLRRRTLSLTKRRGMVVVQPPSRYGEEEGGRGARGTRHHEEARVSDRLRSSRWSVRVFLQIIITAFQCVISSCSRNSRRKRLSTVALNCVCRHTYIFSVVVNFAIHPG